MKISKLKLRRKSALQTKKKLLSLLLVTVMVLVMLPVTALAASNTITSGTYTGIYGNNGTATVPTDDTNASGNTLTIGDGTYGPTLTFISYNGIFGGCAPPGSTGSADGNNPLLPLCS